MRVLGVSHPSSRLRSQVRSISRILASRRPVLRVTVFWGIASEVAAAMRLAVK